MKWWLHKNKKTVIYIFLVGGFFLSFFLMVVIDMCTRLCLKSASNTLGILNWFLKWISSMLICGMFTTHIHTDTHIQYNGNNGSIDFLFWWLNIFNRCIMYLYLLGYINSICRIENFGWLIFKIRINDSIENYIQRGGVYSWIGKTHFNFFFNFWNWYFRSKNYR